MSDGWVYGIAGMVFTALLGAALWGMSEDSKEWDRFKTEHKCKVIARVSGDTFTTLSIDSKGQPIIGTSSTPSKTGWLCDDGVTYYR